MAKKYPVINGARKKPNKNKDGKSNYGAPCVICGKGTIGEKWIQVNWFRGDDESARVCHEHWKTPESEIIEAAFK